MRPFSYFLISKSKLPICSFVEIGVYGLTTASISPSSPGKLALAKIQAQVLKPKDLDVSGVSNLSTAVVGDTCTRESSFDLENSAVNWQLLGGTRLLIGGDNNDGGSIDASQVDDGVVERTKMLSDHVKHKKKNAKDLRTLRGLCRQMMVLVALLCPLSRIGLVS